MKYIKLSDVQELIENMWYADYSWVVRTLKNDLCYLPYIDPEGLIDKIKKTQYCRKQIFELQILRKLLITK